MAVASTPPPPGPSDPHTCGAQMWGQHEAIVGGGSPQTGVETIHDTVSKNRQVSSCMNPESPFIQSEGDRVAGSLHRKRFREVYRPRSYGESCPGGGIPCDVYVHFARVMNCFHIRSEALSPAIKTPGSLLSCCGGAPPGWHPSSKPQECGMGPLVVTFPICLLAWLRLRVNDNRETHPWVCAGRSDYQTQAPTPREGCKGSIYTH